MVTPSATGGSIMTTRKGKLTNFEKYAIQGMVAQKKDVDWIAKQVQRSPKVVQNYIDKELDDIHDTIATVQLAKDNAKQELEQEVEEDTKQQVAELEAELKKAHDKLESAVNPQELTRLHAAITRLQEALPDDSPLKPEHMKETKKAKELMRLKRKNKYGEEVNVGAVMNEGASQRGDELGKKARRGEVSRVTAGNIYRISDGKILEKGDSIHDDK